MNNIDLRDKIKELLKLKDVPVYDRPSDWERNAVEALNDYSEEVESDEKIYDINDPILDELTAREAKNGGWRRVLCFLYDMNPNGEWWYLNGYGNACTVYTDTLMSWLEWAINDLESEDN